MENNKKEILFLFLMNPTFTNFILTISAHNACRGFINLVSNTFSAWLATPCGRNYLFRDNSVGDGLLVQGLLHQYLLGHGLLS